MTFIDNRERPKAERVHVDRVPVNERRRGSNSSYHPGLVTEISELTAAGWNDTEIAAELGISPATLYRWKLAHADFAAALRFNNAAAVDRVRGAFFAKATGYSYIEQQAVKIKTGEHTEAVEVVDVVKHVPPSDTAGIFFLKNRDAANWRDQQDLSLTGAVDFKNVDIRTFALALLATIQTGLAMPTIEHEPTDEASS